jgi:hypothetical protein
MTAQKPKVRRPPGLTIAILATAALYGIVPLMEVYFLHRVKIATNDAFLLGGVDISMWTWLEGVFGGVVLVTCTLAWWGHPRQIRFVLIVLLLVLSGLNLYRIAEAWTSSIDPLYGGQAQSALRGFLRCQLPLMIVVPLYVLWYVNRAPARAFFRHEPLAAPPDSSNGAPGGGPNGDSAA